MLPEGWLINLTMYSRRWTGKPAVHVITMSDHRVTRQGTEQIKRLQYLLQMHKTLNKIHATFLQGKSSPVFYFKNYLLSSVGSPHFQRTMKNNQDVKNFILHEVQGYFYCPGRTSESRMIPQTGGRRHFLISQMLVIVKVRTHASESLCSRDV